MFEQEYFTVDKFSQLHSFNSSIHAYEGYIQAVTRSIFLLIYLPSINSSLTYVKSFNSIIHVRVRVMAYSKFIQAVAAIRRRQVNYTDI